MENTLEKLFEKALFKPISIVIVWVFFVLAFLKTIPESMSDINWKHYTYIACYFFIAVIYSIVCIKRNMLPKGKNKESSILFIIEAENHQLFQEVKAKLVSEFDNYSHKEFGRCFEAICVEKRQIAKKYDIKKSIFAIELLEKTNCVFLIDVKYVVDSATCSEHFKMQIDIGVILPAINEKARSAFLQTDIHDLYRSIKSRKFDKAHLLDEMTFTAVTLNIICRYVFGIVALLTEKPIQSYSMLHDTYQSISSTDNMGFLPRDYCSRLKYWLFFSCLRVAEFYQNQFYLNKDETLLSKMDSMIEEANGLYPNTYDYFLMKAYILVAQDGNMSSVKHCIDMCKKSNAHDNWKYSEAFISAYEGNPGLAIYRKYMKAFSADQDLQQIAEYVEYILEKKPELSSLHLAAGLVYDKMGDADLANNHFNLYFQSVTDKAVQGILMKRKKWQPLEDGQSLAVLRNDCL